MFSKPKITNLSFLIIDDNSMMVTILKTLLHGFGVHEIYDANDAISGFEELTSTKIDIILLDNKMNTLDGIEFTRMVRTANDSPNHYIPIIMISAYTERSRIQAARDVGVNEFICKPISAKSLNARITEVIEHPRKFIETPQYFGPDRRRIKKSGYNGPERRGQKVKPKTTVEEQV
ncbi:MAG: two-component system response regulator [Hyphomicrobiales bacterium]|nr:MAG: two-component system response regulator [Hyphomicrobiales bacterium]